MTIESISKVNELLKQKNQISAMRKQKKFDLTVLCYGDSGSGKTHLAGSYDKGPVHFYAFDPNTYKTLLNCKNPNITISQFNEEPGKTMIFADFWEEFKKDAASGLFTALADAEGMIVIDSLTTMSRACLHFCMTDVTTQNKTPFNPYKDQPEVQHYGRQMNILTEFFRILASMPCASFLTAHVEYLTDKQGNVLRQMPLITGKLKSQAGLWFDETWLQKRVTGTHSTVFRGTGGFLATTRFLPCDSANNLNLNQIYDYWVNGIASDNLKPAQASGAVKKTVVGNPKQ